MASDENNPQSDIEQEKRKVPLKMIGIICALIIAIGAGGAYFFLADPEMLSEQEASDGAKTYTYFELPEMLLNLQHEEASAEYLKINISLELENREHIAVIERLSPRIMDVFQTYMRALRSSDLDGASGVYHLRRALLKRVNIVVDPVEVHDILFKQIMIQ